MSTETEQLQHCARLLRLGRDVEAALPVVELFEQLMPRFEAAPSHYRDAWLQALARMLASQQCHDWIGLADDLEYDVVDLLQAMAADTGR